MVGLGPLDSYLPYLRLLQSHSATQDAGILSLNAIAVSSHAHADHIDPYSLMTTQDASHLSSRTDNSMSSLKRERRPL